MLNLIKKNLNIKNGIALIVLVMFFVFLSNSFKKNKSKDISNFVVSVEKGILSESINTSGEVKANRTSNIGPRKQGIIEEIKVEEGDLVEKGKFAACAFAFSTSALNKVDFATFGNPIIPAFNI